MSYGPLDLLGNIGVVILMITYLMLQLNKLSSFVGIYRYFRLKALHSQTLDG